MSRRSEYQRYLMSAAWQKKRREAFDAHGRHCNRCGSTNRALHVHHKRYGKNLDAIPVNLLEVLCKQCHEKHHRQEAQDRKLRRAEKALSGGTHKNLNRSSLEHLQMRRERRKSRHLTALILDHDAT